MGTRCLTTVMDGNKEILCMYRQMDGYPEGHGVELREAFKGFVITNGISHVPQYTANGAGCLAAQVVHVFKSAKSHAHSSTNAVGNGAAAGGIYLYAPETREVGEEFIYRLSVREDGNQDSKAPWQKTGRIWLDVSEGEVAFFGMPGTKPELMEWLFSGWLDDFDPSQCGQVYHAA